MTYYELESMVNSKEVCLFGGGVYGKTHGYDYVTALGFKVDFYCDNSIAPGTIIRDGIEVRDIQYLYENKEHIQVFLTISYKYRAQIIDQLHEHDIYNIILVDWLLVSQVLDSIDATDDELIKQRCHAIYNDAEYLERRFKWKMGYELDINHPKTFNEKLQWLKLYDRKSEYTRMVDKYEMKQYIEEKIGSGYTVPTLGVWDSFDEIDFSKLPDQFVLKCTHDSGSIVIVDDKKNFDKEEARRILNRSLGINSYWISREWPYKNVHSRIIAEKYMVDESGFELKDYKIFCFNGGPEYIEVDFNRFIEHKLNPYDFEWNPLNFCDKSKNDYSADIKRPKRLTDMYNIAAELSKDMKFLRVDFYSIENEIYVGELTLYPGGGFIQFDPSSVDLKYGQLLDLGD